MSKIRIVNLSSYVAPKVKEEQNKDFISYGEDNNYYQYLIDQYQGSPTNNAIINGVTEMIYGKGLNATNSDKRPEEYAKMITLFKKDDVKKIASDFYLLGQAAMQIIYNVDRSQIVKVEHFPIQTLRAEKANDKGEIKGYYYFHDWSKYNNRSTTKRIAAFGSSQNEANEILVIKPYKAGYFYYAPPCYMGALPYCELEGEVANYHINNIQQGMAPSMLINFNNGVPDDEQRELIEQRIYEKYSGSSNAGKFILCFNEDSEAQANVEPINLPDAHAQYEFLAKESREKIMIGHGVVSPILLGIKDNTGFGNNADSRRFCQRMELLTGQNLVFRKEDINMMSFKGINKELGHKVSKKFQLESKKVEYIYCDVGSEASTLELGEKLLGKKKSIEILMHFAGIGLEKKFVNTSLDDWNKIISVNLTGYFFPKNIHLEGRT